MASQRIKDSIKSKLIEQKVEVPNVENITNALIKTVSGEKLVRIAIKMFNDGEL